MNIRDRVKELRRVPASELHPSPFNWRTHPKHQLDALRGVLAEIGYAAAALARELPDGALQLIDGHARADISGDTPIPVLVLDVTESEAKTILATFDPLGAMAESNAAALDALLRDVQVQNASVVGMLEDLAKDAGCDWAQPEAGAGGDEFDTTPEEAGPTRTQTGELWVIGGKHRLLVGDCTVPENVARLMDGAKPFLMVTDPPYGVEYDPEWREERLPGGERRLGAVANDGRIDWTDAYKLFPGAVTYVWHAGRHARLLVENLESAGFTIRSQIIWAKPGFVISRGHYHWQHEPCWYAFREGESAKWSGDRSQTTLWEITNKVNDEDKNNHGTQKPLECMARPIRNHGAEGDIVYDPFLGSGTTLIAAHRLGRICYGCELEPKYADVILKRAEAEGLECVRDG